MLADLAETIRGLLKVEPDRHGFEGVDIAFDAPAREWSGQLSKPTVNMFLYDLREAETMRTSERSRVVKDGRSLEGRPPMIMKCSYAVTAWTQAVEDEHRLLSQVLAIFNAYPELPQAVLNGRLANGSQQGVPIKARIGQGKGEKSDFWSAIGGQYKVSLDYVVRLSVDSGAKLERGPEVRTQTVRTRLSDGPARAIVEMHRSVGRISDSKGQPLADVWITLPDIGSWTSSRSD